MTEALLRVLLEKYGIKINPSTRIVEFTHGAKLPDGKKLTFGDDNDVALLYDEATNDRLEFQDAASNILFYVKDDGAIGSAGAPGGKLDVGDAGGFSGLVWDPTGTSIQVNIDGTLTHSLETDGTLTDEVA